jgi:hypothetical protein
MTDTVSRQAVIDAVRSVPPGTTCRGDAIIAAINAIPAVTVTDDVVQRAVHAYQGHCGDLVFEDSIKVALVAAWGEKI